MNTFARHAARTAPAALLALIVGCAVESTDSTSPPSASPSSPVAAAPGALKPRAAPAKPLAAVQSTFLHDDEIIVKFKEGTHVRLRSGALKFDAAALAPTEHKLLARHGLG